MDETLKQKIEALESRCAFQEDNIEALNRSVAKLTQEVEDLRQQLFHTHRMLRDSMESMGGDVGGQEKPPHY